MSNGISQASVVRGADGRLFAITAAGVREVSETGASPARAMLRAGDRVAFDAADHEAARTAVVPGM